MVNKLFTFVELRKLPIHPIPRMLKKKCRYSGKLPQPNIRNKLLFLNMTSWATFKFDQSSSFGTIRDETASFRQSVRKVRYPLISTTKLFVRRGNKLLCPPHFSSRSFDRKFVFLKRQANSRITCKHGGWSLLSWMWIEQTS